MKLLVVALLVSLNSHAVEVRNCPSKLGVAFTNIRVTVTLQNIVTSLTQFGSLETEELKALEATYKNLAKNPTVANNYKIVAAKNGQCRYASVLSRAGGSEDYVTIYSKGGKDIFMVQNNIGPRGIAVRAYAQIESLNPGYVKVSTRYPGIALAIPRYPYTDYEAGGALEFVGGTEKFSVLAK